MQLNLYIPKHREPLLAELDRLAKETGKAKSEMVLEALEHFVRENRRVLSPPLKRFSMGQMKGTLGRESVYDEDVHDRD